MRLAGLDIPIAHALDLAEMLRRADYAHAADTIEGAVAAGLPDVALTILDRTAILLVLEPARLPVARVRGNAPRPPPQREPDRRARFHPAERAELRH